MVLETNEKYKQQLPVSGDKGIEGEFSVSSKTEKEEEWDNQSERI